MDYYWLLFIYFVYLFVYLFAFLFVNCIVDSTRITLADVDPTAPGSDYINANLIKVH